MSVLVPIHRVFTTDSQNTESVKTFLKFSIPAHSAFSKPKSCILMNAIPIANMRGTRPKITKPIRGMEARAVPAISSLLVRLFGGCFTGRAVLASPP